MVFISEMSKLNLTPKTLEEAIEIIREFAKEMAILREENQHLKEQLNVNSKNSSLPPSKDLKKNLKKR